MWNDRTFNACRLTFSLGYTSQTCGTMKVSSCSVAELEDNNLKVYIFSKIKVHAKNTYQCINNKH